MRASTRVAQLALAIAIGGGGIVAPTAHGIEIGPGNVVTGDCQALADRIRSRGVVDAGGAHPGRPGNTHASVEPALPRFGMAFKPSADGQVCASTSLKIALKVTSVSTRLDWQPDKGSAKACAEQRKAWIATIEAHEADHVKDNQRLAADFNGAVQPRSFEACGRSAEAAREALTAKLQVDVDAAIEQLALKLKQAEAAYHDRHGSSVEAPSCCGRKISFRDVTIDCTIQMPRCTVRMGQRLSGTACGDPTVATWTISPRHFVEGCGAPATGTRGDKDFSNDCVLAGSEDEARRVAIYRQARASGGAGGWICVYNPQPEPTITIRNFRLRQCSGAAEQTVTVKAEVSPQCDAPARPPAAPGPTPGANRPNS